VLHFCTVHLLKFNFIDFILFTIDIYLVYPCHQGMTRPRVVDGGMASNMEGSCEYIEKAVTDS